MANSTLLSQGHARTYIHTCACAHTHTSCCSPWSPAEPSPCHCQKMNCENSVAMRPWTHVHWIHCHLSHCCLHQCHQPGWGLDKAGAAGPQETGLLQNKKVLQAWGLLPHQPLLGDRSCLGHAVEDKTGKVKRGHHGCTTGLLRGLDKGGGTPVSKG